MAVNGAAVYLAHDKFEMHTSATTFTKKLKNGHRTFSTCTINR